jgi:nitrite reductase/ring-hydroxylating ferredoxin subunit
MRIIAGTTGPVEVPRLAPHPPSLVASWHMVAPAGALRRGGILRAALGDLPLVLFRGRRDAVVRTLPAHCEHQGVDLAQGSVSGDCLRCPLHHWEYTDRCVRSNGRMRAVEELRRPQYVTAERHGMIFIHPGDVASSPLPTFRTVDESTLHFRAGRAVHLDAPWFVPIANAFDITHLETVHRRRLERGPTIEYPDATTFVLRYGTSVTGNGWSDRVMRAMSGNRIDVTITCAGGPVVMVESVAGTHRSHMMIAVTPVRDGVSILPLYAVPRRRDGLHRAHAFAAHLLFTAFLGRDIRPLSGIRFPPQFRDDGDATLNACYRFLCALPEHRVEDRS